MTRECYLKYQQLQLQLQQMTGFLQQMAIHTGMQPPPAPQTAPVAFPGGGDAVAEAPAPHLQPGQVQGGETAQRSVSNKVSENYKEWSLDFYPW